MSQETEESRWEYTDDHWEEPECDEEDVVFTAQAVQGQKVVALDDGHGMDTPGKRTPIFPAGSGMKNETGGNFMHENEFNRSVIKYAKEHLERSGVKVILTAPGDEDVPLGTRGKTAIAAKADLFISVHANASKGVWGNAKGVEVFYQTGAAANSVKLANIMLKHLLQHTPQSNRGVRAENFQVTRDTHKYMASALLECSFMDNLEEAKLLISDLYRKECGEEIARGAMEYFGLPFTEESKPSQAVKEPAVSEVSVQVDQRPLTVKGFLRGDASYVPVRAVSIAAGVSVAYNPKSGKASINEVELTSTVVIGNDSFAQSREVAAAIDRIATWSPVLRKVTLLKGE